MLFGTSRNARSLLLFRLQMERLNLKRMKIELNGVLYKTKFATQVFHQVTLPHRYEGERKLNLGAGDRSARRFVYAEDGSASPVRLER